MVKAVLAENPTRELGALVAPDALNALSGRDDGTFVEQGEGVGGASLVLHEDHLLPLGLLVDKLGCVPEVSQRRRRERAEGVDEYYLERTLDVVSGLLRVRLLRALPEWARTTVLHVTGVVDAILQLLPQDIHALPVEVPHAPVPEISRFRPQGQTGGGASGDLLAPSTTPKLQPNGVHELTGRGCLSQVLHRNRHVF